MSIQVKQGGDIVRVLGERGTSTCREKISEELDLQNPLTHTWEHNGKALLSIKNNLPQVIQFGREII